MHHAGSTPCTRITLAASSAARVELCTCGIIHLTMGPVTLRLEAEGLPAILQTLKEAERALPRDRFEIRSLLTSGSRH